MDITASMVKELREQTGAGLMDCKNALAETSGDVEAAIDWLRKKGMKSADKKAGRDTGEGRVFAQVAADSKSGAMIAVACETDFVAKTPDFQGFLNALCAHVAENAPESVEACLEQSWKAGGTVSDALKGTIGSLGENMQILEVASLTSPNGVVNAYIHHDHKKGGLVALETEADAPTASETAKQVGMHVTVYSPVALNRDEIPAETVERERAIHREKVKDKPAEMQDKIIDGMMGKFYAETVLTEQPWVMDDKLKTAKAVEETLGKGSTILAYRRFAIGG